jgi:hypothetical protein
MERQAKAAKTAPPPSERADAPPPVVKPQAQPSAAGPGAVSYISDAEKARLFAKYGKLAPPTAADVSDLARSGASCKMQ